MVKIPDIEDFSSRRDFGVDRDVRPAVTQANISNAGAPGAALAGVGRAIAGLGGDLQAVADKQKAEQDQLAGFKAQTGYYEMLGNIDRETAEAKKSAAPDGTGWDQTSAGIRQRNTTSFLNGLTDPKLRARFEPHIAEVNRTYETRDRSFVEQQRNGFYKAEIDKYGGATAVALEKNPDSWNDVVGGFAQLLAKSGLPEKDREAVLDKGTRQFAQARIRGLTAQGRFDEAKAFADQEDAREAARVGVTPSAPRAGSPPRAGAMDPRTVHSMFRAEVERQGLVGMVPMDGPKYGIRTGSAEEWANYFTGLAKHESGLKNSTVGDVGDFEGGSRGLLQLSYADAPRYGLNDGKPFTPEQLADPAQNAAAGVAITKQLVDKAGTIRGGAGKYWGPITKENWTPGNGRDRDLPWNELSSGQSPVPVQGSLTLGAYATSLQNQQQHAQLQQQNAERAALKQQHEAWVNQFEFGVIDGKVGMADLQLARDNGLVTDAGEYQKLEKLIEDRQGETNIFADVIDKIDGQNKAYAFDPLDKDDKKAVEAYSQAYKLGEGIGKQDPSVINRASNVVDRTGMIPRDVVGPLQAKFRSTDVGAFTFGMQAMQALYQRSPDVFAKTFGEKVTQSVATWGQLAPYRSAQESFDLIKKDSDPAAAAQKEKLLKEADKAMKDAPITAADLPAIFYGNMDYEGPASKDLGPWDKDRWAGGPPMAPAQSQLQFDYAKLYRENYALAQGDADVAKKTTIQQMQRMWGETRVHGAGGSSAWGVFGLRDRVVKYPPERFYPPVDGSYDWLKGAVEDAVKGNAEAVADWELLPVPETAADVKAGSAPRYGIMVKNDAGVWSELRDQSNQPLLIDFDPKASRRAGQDKAQQEAAVAAGRQAAAGDANRDLYQAGGNPFALMPQEQVAPGPEVNAAMQRRLGPKTGVGSAKIPE